MVSPLDNSKRSANSERGAFLFAFLVVASYRVVRVTPATMTAGRSWGRCRVTHHPPDSGDDRDEHDGHGDGDYRQHRIDLLGTQVVDQGPGHGRCTAPGAAYLVMRDERVPP
jgi:hypothetical protein